MPLSPDLLSPQDPPGGCQRGAGRHGGRGSPAPPAQARSGLQRLPGSATATDGDGLGASQFLELHGASVSRAHMVRVPVVLAGSVLRTQLQTVREPLCRCRQVVQGLCPRLRGRPRPRRVGVVFCGQRQGPE